ncbi:sensor histidine kinase [Adhaeribacter arboris]|uniref:histidine kinase n=1 Tax=Adhaeribacter arboris TaxID=2072846 RepID=A0A2T2YLQ0_9BACT|nr:HAMP domain-containing sensor histidine kinase [Adhaeribacter arboris]PSR56430.1 sensor histidine kinase [Adhaeribacter arboris]
MSKLLNKPLKAFTIYALFVLAASIPVYLFIVDSIWLTELDEHNQIVRERIEHRLKTINFTDAAFEQSLALWNQIQPGTSLKPATTSEIKPDQHYTIRRQNEFNQERDRFRCLSVYLQVKGKPYHLLVETNVEETEETMLAIATVTLLFFLLLMGGFIFLNHKISQSIWQPFQKTLEQLKTFDLNSQCNIEFGQTNIQEFTELNQALNKLIEKNISVYRQQKEFTENASHELQTPLALIKSKLDLMLQNELLTEEQAHIIESINIPLARVSRINKNLLLLAKIENYQFDENEAVDLNQLLQQNLDLLMEHMEGKGLTVENQLRENIILKTNKSLLEILLTNLLLNAIRHTPRNGKIKVEQAIGELKIWNTGEKPLNSGNLFKRFISSSMEAPSSGLGLAIVQQICHQYHWSIRYMFQQGGHLFVIRF